MKRFLSSIEKHSPNTPRNVACYAVLQAYAKPGMTPEAVVQLLKDAGLGTAEAHVKYLTRLSVLNWRTGA